MRLFKWFKREKPMDFTKLSQLHPSSQVSIHAPSILRTIEMANALRDALGETRLNDLPRGRRKHPRECILAKAFNFQCEVTGAGEGRWAVSFPDWHMSPEQIDTIKRWAKSHNLVPHGGNLSYILPVEVGDLAMRFDCGLLRQYEYVRSPRFV